MKVLLTAINSKYIHSNLAVYSLKAYAEKHLAGQDVLPVEANRSAIEVEIEIAEYTINQPASKILADIYEKAADVLFFSCYIWNRQVVRQLAVELKKISPKTDIWLGGPEVSCDAEQTMKGFPTLKGILRGEGEASFYHVTRAYAEVENDYRQVSGTGTTLEEKLERIPGILFRSQNGNVAFTGERAPLHMDSCPFPYQDLGDFENRILYYESSRGCPFRCSYCLSSIEKTLRFRSFEQVKRELDFFLEQKAMQVKFIDRTFNCDRQRALSIWQYLREHDNGITNFHFEIAADLLTQEQIRALGSMRPGQVQLEIGVQTTNERTLREIQRPMDFSRLSEAVCALRRLGNIHLHLDLIAGLPYEDKTSFEKSFDDVFALQPHQLQLGFLKVLRGSMMWEKAQTYGVQYTEAPPYEVLETRWISYQELLRLKHVEEMVEVYYNSGQFQRSIARLISGFDSPFAFFLQLAEWHQKHGKPMVTFSRNQRYENLMRFGQELWKNERGTAGSDLQIDGSSLKNALIYDYYARDNAKNRPDFFGPETVEKTFTKKFYSMEAREHRYLTGRQYEDTADPRVLRKLTHLEKLDGKIYLFDYTQRSPIDHNANIIEITERT